MYCFEFSESPTELSGIYKEFVTEITLYIAENATSLRLTRYTYVEHGFLSTTNHFTDDDPVIENIKNLLSVEHIKDENVALAYYGDNEKFGNSGERHVFWYRISNKIRTILHASTVVIEDEGGEDFWPGFEDPVYYQNETVIAFVMSTEKKLYLGELPEFESIIHRFNIPFEKVD